MIAESRRAGWPSRFVTVLSAGLAACSAEINVGLQLEAADAGDARGVSASLPDLARPPFDLAYEEPDLGPPNPCGDWDPGCLGGGADPRGGRPIPLPGDPNVEPGVGADGVGRDPDGYLALDQTRSVFDFLWIANSNDWGRGTVSKVDSRKLKEVARYFSVTCFSTAKGSTAACDGTSGCCAADDNARYLARLAGMPEPGRQAVQTGANSPSRTAVDFNGDVFIANRAFGGQGSVTKIQNDDTTCRDRNGNGVIDTSHDADSDGVITTDCNADGQPDDLATVVARPCTNGGKQEFFGLDDECVLFTTNHGTRDRIARPLTLGAGMGDKDASDAWPGNYNDGKFYRVDGTSGRIKAEAKVPMNAYGAAVDSNGILWVAVIYNGRLAYFDTKNPGVTGTTRPPDGAYAYGIALDRDQNLWQGGYPGGNAYRYTPDRTKGFAELGAGFWTIYSRPGANAGAAGNTRGIAVDSRNPMGFFGWVARDGGWVVRLDASSVPLPVGADKTIDASGFPAFRVAGNDTIGIGVDRDQNVWGVSRGGNVVTRVAVDNMGVGKAPDVASPPAMGTRCPAGDRCRLQDGNSDLQPYTYSDFTGFGLRNFTRPRGTYTMRLAGCRDDQGVVGDTQWNTFTWDAEVPPMTSLTVRLRVGPTPVPDETWGPWIDEQSVSPLDFTQGIINLLPADRGNGHMQIDFLFTSSGRDVTPRLKSFNAAFKCRILG